MKKKQFLPEYGKMDVWPTEKSFHQVSANSYVLFMDWEDMHIRYSDKFSD